MRPKPQESSVSESVFAVPNISCKNISKMLNYTIKPIRNNAVTKAESRKDQRQNINNNTESKPNSGSNDRNSNVNVCEM